MGVRLIISDACIGLALLSSIDQEVSARRFAIIEGRDWSERRPKQATTALLPGHGQP